MNQFEEYVSYVLIKDVPKRIYVTSEKLDKYLEDNELLIAPKLKGYNELVNWLCPENLNKSISTVMDTIKSAEDFNQLIHKSTELIHKRNEFIKKHSKVVDLSLLK